MTVEEKRRSPVVITAENLSAGYKDHVVWEKAQLNITAGEFVAIIGPNGAGKTTLFRLILGLQHPITGIIKVLGHEPQRGNERIGYVPQRHIVDGETGIESLELVRLGVSGKKWGFSLFSNKERKIAIDALDAVGARELAYRPLNLLSGGELQRIFLAEALASSPDILLLDEPLSNLDLRREKELVELVNNVVRERKVTALLIAHNINPLLSFLDKVIYIANSRVATGKPSEVLNSQTLSELYGVPIEVLHSSTGNIAIVGAESHQHMNH